METSISKLRLETLEFLKKYPELRLQYLFFNCFVISSKESMINYLIAKSEHKTNLKDIEIYYTPEYLYSLEKDAPIFDRINTQKIKKYYYLKEHIFYYQYLLKCLKTKKIKGKNETGNKKGADNKETTDSSNINKIAYRTLMNRLYLLYDGINSNNNYGINQVFGASCIYSIIEPNILEQIITMKKFSFDLMKMEANKFIDLFGINDELDKHSYLYNNLLLSISEDNSSINEINYKKEDININNINKGVIQIEKNLIDLSSELFLFYYITKQFDKKNLIQIPRILFFSCLYDDKYRNIYEIQEDKENTKIKKKENEKKNQHEIQTKTSEAKRMKITGINTNNIGIIKQKKIGLKVIDKQKVKKMKKVTNKSKEKIEVKSGYIKVKRLEKLKSNEIKNVEKNQIKEELNNEIIQGKNNNKNVNFETPKIKHLLKCELMSFCGTLELDGAFKYTGNTLEIKGDSLVIILSECLNDDNNNIKLIKQKLEAINLIPQIKNQNIAELKSLIQKYEAIKEEVMEDDKEKIVKKLKDMSEKKIITDKRIIINSNDIVLIENKREYPHHLSDEIRNFIEHSFYFINLYRNLNLINNNNNIHLIFIYEHYRHYDDEKKSFIELFKIIKDNKDKLNLFSNKIKFYLVHSLPNLNLSIFDGLQNNISDLENEIVDLKNKNEKLSSIVYEFKKQNKKLEDAERYMTKINELQEQIKNLNIKISNLESTKK